MFQVSYEFTFDAGMLLLLLNLLYTVKLFFVFFQRSSLDSRLWRRL